MRSYLRAGAALLVLLAAFPATAGYQGPAATQGKGRPKDKEPDPKILPSVTDEVLKGVLKGLGLKHEKKSVRNDVTCFEFNMAGHRVRLLNFGGKDLMLDAAFRKLPLEAANDYNLRRKFVRAVVYAKGDRGEHTALEANLDCVAGVTEGMIRYFVTTFGGEVEEFTKYVRGQQAGGPPPAPAPAGDDLIGIRWKAFDKASGPFYQVLTTRTAQQMTFLKQQVSQQQTFFIKWTPGDKADGNWVVTQQIIGVRMEIDIGGVKIAYDSLDDRQGKKDPMTEFFERPIRVKLTFHINQSWGWVNFLGLNLCAYGGRTSVA